MNPSKPSIVRGRRFLDACRAAELGIAVEVDAAAVAGAARSSWPGSAWGGDVGAGVAGRHRAFLFVRQNTPMSSTATTIPAICSARATHRPARNRGASATGNVNAAMSPPAPASAATSEIV